MPYRPNTIQKYNLSSKNWMQFTQAERKQD